MLLYNISTLQHRDAGSFTRVTFRDASIVTFFMLRVGLSVPSNVVSRLQARPVWNSPFRSFLPSRSLSFSVRLLSLSRHNSWRGQLSPSKLPIENREKSYRYVLIGCNEYTRTCDFVKKEKEKWVAREKEINSRWLFRRFVKAPSLHFFSGSYLLLLLSCRLYSRTASFVVKLDARVPKTHDAPRS